MKKFVNKFATILAALVVIVGVASLAGCKKNPSSSTDPNSSSQQTSSSLDGNSSSSSSSGTDFTDITVRSASSKDGVVTSGSPFASKAGLDVLAAGGNAYDAAVAVAFALGIVEPYASGLGGGGSMVAYDAKSGEVVYYNFPALAPGAAEPGIALTNYETEMKRGIKSIGIPMETTGLLSIKEDLGSSTLTLSQVMQPAITLAEDGFIVPSTVAGNIDFDNFKKRPDECGEALTTYGNGLRAYRTGDTMKNANYAKVLKEIASKGKAGFYSGWVSEAVVNAINTQGADNIKGLLSAADMTYAMNFEPKYETLHTTYSVYGTSDKYDLYTCSLGGGGIVVAEMLNMLEHYAETLEKPLSSLGHNSVEYVHAVCESMHLSYNDKRHYAGDRRTVDMPYEGLISKAYAADRFDYAFKADDTYRKTSSYNYGGAYKASDPNDPDPYNYQSAVQRLSYVDDEINEETGTTSLSVADSEGNVVTLTQTLNSYWGSYVMPKGTGFFLNNSLTNFGLTETSKNRVGPYKLACAYISPMIVMKNGSPVMSIGSPGSEKIPVAIAQTFLNIVEFNMGIQEAIAASRVFSYYVSTNDTQEMADGASYSTHKLMYMETTDIADGVLAGLANKHYYVHEYASKTSSMGGVAGIIVNYDARGNVTSYDAGADPRRGGKALGL